MEIQKTKNEVFPVAWETPSKAMPVTSPLAHAPSRLIGIVKRKQRAPIFVGSRNIFELSDPTEIFLTTARPATLVATTLAAAELIKPWKLLPGSENNRDWVRVLLVVLLFPWNLFGWRKYADTLAKDHNNSEFINHIQQHEGKVVVFSNGFTPIMGPLIESLGLTNHVNARLFSWRGQQHLSSTERIIGSPFSKILGNSIVITDSPTEPLLESCQTPLVTVPRVRTVIPTPDAYIPLRYIHLTKNPRRKFIEYAWLKDDLYVAVVASSTTTVALFPFHAVGIILASLALWTTYEAGYHENDVFGESREAEPVLPTNFAEVKGSVPTVLPWVWAGGLTTVASFFLAIGLSEPLVTAPILALKWMAVLIAVRALFSVFNRLQKPMRVIPHLLLQTGKYVGFAVISSLSFVGLALLIAQVIYRWIPYAVYRWHPAKTYIEEPLTRTRLFIFWLIAIPAVAISPSPILGVQLILGSLILGHRAASTHLRIRASQATT